MQNKLKHFLLVILFPLWGLGGFAQTYPVTIYSQFTYPTPIYLSDFANTTTINSPIKVQLMLNDLNIMDRQIRLKFYLQGRMSLVSKDYVIGVQPIYLQGGYPLQLTNVELGPYFEFQNLQGINPNQYGQPIPEGSYDFCVEVYDFATNKKLSKKTCVTTVIFQNDPPILNLPANNEKVMKQDIQNIVFSWTPRNINVSNVEYEFSLVELWNPNIPYQTAFDYAPPLYTETTNITTLQYDMMKPQLIPGKSYAWRVKAKAMKGAEEIGMFKNNGFSEIFTFKYLSQCNAPMNVTTEGVSQDQAKIKWTGTATNSFDYQVNYREKNARSKWYTIVSPREYATITNLKPNTAYEYTVGTACDIGEYTLSSINEFTTLAHDEIAFAGCGIKPDPADLANKTPLPALYPNDVVTAGDFPIVVQHVSGGNGTFSGDGFVTFPFIDKFKKAIGGTFDANSDQNVGIKITFNNIGVNTDFKLISWEIVASYDADKWNKMLDADKLVEDIKNLVTSIKESFDKLDKLEEQKKTGAISNEEYIKDKEAIWNDIQKANNQYKELIKAKDLPDELKEKVAALTPPLPDLASNDNTAVKGNPESQKKEYLEKIDEIAKDVEALSKSQLQITEIDLEGIKKSESIIFLVNGHYSKLLPGPSRGGKEYWDYFDNDHSEQFRKYFNLNNNKLQIIYVNGSSIIGIDKDFKDRFKLGQNYIKKIIKNMGDFQNKNIAIIGHSEGVAYAAGMVEELYNDKAKIKEAVYLSGDECAENGAYTNPNVPTYQIEYMYFDKSFPDGNCEAEYDWVIGTDHRYDSYSGLKGVTKFGIAIRNNLDYQTVHGASGNATKIIPFLNDLKKVTILQYLNSEGKAFYNHSKTSENSLFYKINDTFIFPNHPQFNQKKGLIDTSLPCKN